MESIILEQPTSFRHVGLQKGGKICKGHPNNSINGAVAQHRGPTSIPGKFETILNVGQHELDGFGGRTYRFGDSESDLPGPGSYYKPSSFLKTTNDSGSVSKKGYSTGFVSKTKRFTQSQSLARRLPGPGQYDSPSFVDRCKPANCATSSFAQSKPKVEVKKEDVPGPGHYSIEKSIRRAKPSSVFCSRTDRGSYLLANKNPPPGQYEISSFVESRQTKSQSSVFRSNTQRAKFMIQNPEVPGPGSYTDELIKPSQKFDHTAPQVDRFGNPVIRRTVIETTPGPGSYDPEKPREKALASSSCFVSNAPRILDTVDRHKPPGPAYYNPAKLGKKSFHLNATTNWL